MTRNILARLLSSLLGKLQVHNRSFYWTEALQTVLTDAVETNVFWYTTCTPLLLFWELQTAAGYKGV